MKEQLEEFRNAWLLFGGKRVLVDLLETIIDTLDQGISEEQIEEIRKGLTTPMDASQFKEVRDAQGNLLYMALHDDYKALLDRLKQLEIDINQLRDAN